MTTLANAAHACNVRDLPEISLGAARIRFPIPASATGGAYEVIEFRGEPGGIGPPSHVHRNADEAFIVLEGALDMEVAGRAFRAEAGAAIHVPKGTPHRFEYAQPGTRFLAMLAPATRFDAYAQAVAELVAANPGKPPDPALRAALMARHDMYPA